MGQVHHRTFPQTDEQIVVTAQKWKAVVLDEEVTEAVEEVEVVGPLLDIMTINSQTTWTQNLKFLEKTGRIIVGATEIEKGIARGIMRGKGVMTVHVGAIIIDLTGEDAFLIIRVIPLLSASDFNIVFPSINYRLLPDLFTDFVV